MTVTDPGVQVERLRAMRPGTMMARINGHIQGWLITEEGRAALEEIRVSLRRMAHRAAAASQGPGSTITNSNVRMVGDK